MKTKVKFGLNLTTLIKKCHEQNWHVASNLEGSEIQVVAGAKMLVASITPGPVVVSLRKGHKAASLIENWVIPAATPVETAVQEILEEKKEEEVKVMKNPGIQIEKKRRDVEVNRPTDRLLSTSSVVLFSSLWTPEEKWEKLHNTMLHRMLPGEEDVNLVFRISTIQTMPMPILKAPRPATIVTTNEYGVEEDVQVLELDALTAGFDNLMGASVKGQIQPSHYTKLMTLLEKDADRRIKIGLMKADTRPGLQAPAICADTLVDPGEIAIAEEDAIGMAYEICGVDMNTLAPINLPPNTKMVRWELFQRIKEQDGMLYAQFGNAFRETDKKAYGWLVSENINFIVETLNKMTAWVVRFPCTSVPIMRIRVIKNAPGRAIFINSTDMKHIFNGDFDGDFLYLTLVGKKKKAKTKVEALVAGIIERQYAPSITWVDALTPQPGQIKHDFHYDLRFRLKAKFKIMGQELTERLLEDHGINGSFKNAILSKLQVMVGFEQRNWVGILTWLAWQLYWVVVNEIGARADVENQEAINHLVQKCNEESDRVGSPITRLNPVMQELLSKMDNPNGVYKGTTRRIWAEKSFGVVIWLLESCFDARKLTDATLAANLAVSIVNCMMGATGVPVDTITRAYEKMDRTEKEIKECINLLQNVIDFQAMGDGTMDLTDVLVGTGQSLTWEKFVTQRSNPTSMQKFRKELKQMGIKNPYQFMVDELTFEKIYDRKIKRQERKERIPLQAFLMENLPDPGKEVHISRFVRPDADVLKARDASADLIYIKIKEMAENFFLENKDLLEAYGPTQFRLVDKADGFTYLEKMYYPTSSKGEPMMNKQGKQVERVIRVRLPKVSPLQKMYREGQPAAVVQRVEAQEGRFVYRPVLTNAHFGNLPEDTLNTPMLAAWQICQPVNDESPWFVRTFEDTYARAVFAAYQAIDLRQITKEAYAATETQLRSWVQASVKDELEKLERFTRADQLRVIGEEIALDFEFQPGTRIPQTTEQAIKGVMWKLLLNIGYDTVCTSKSQNGTVACWIGDRQAPLWMAGLNPLAAASRQQRLLRELRSVSKQGLLYVHPDAGKQRVVNGKYALPGEFRKSTMEVLVCYADTLQTTLHEGWLANILDEDGNPVADICSPDQGKTFPAGIERLDAYEMKVDVQDLGHRTYQEVYAELQAKYPGSKVEEVTQTTAAGTKRVFRVAYQDHRPGSGTFKVTFVENVVKFMTIPTTVQWYADIAGVMTPLHMLASAQSVFDKDGQTGVLRAAMSLVSSYENPWVLEDDMSVDQLNELIPEVDAKLTAAGIVDSLGRVNGRVPVYADPKGENYVGDYTIGWQTVIRTPHDDKSSTKLKGIKQDPHVRHLGDIPLFTNKRDEQQINRTLSLANVMEEKARRTVATVVEIYEDVDEESAMLDTYEGQEYADDDDDA